MGEASVDAGSEVRNRNSGKGSLGGRVRGGRAGGERGACGAGGGSGAGGAGGGRECRHLVQAIGLEALKAGFVVLYRSIFDLVRELLTQETLAGEARLLKKYLKPDLLVIDDMGLKILPSKSGEILLEIIMRRYENRSTMMTSNRPIEEWGKLLSDVPAAGAILDRLLHHAEIIPINGRSYRLQPTAKQPPSKK